MAEDLVTTKEIESVCTLGHIGYFMHNPERPHDQQSGLQEKFWNLSIVREKISVESGVFIPGVYRVNPYSVKGGFCCVRDDSPGALYLHEDFDPGAANWPGINPNHTALINEKTPVYAVSVPFINTYWTSYGGYVPGNIYYQSAYLFGDWWRYALPNLASIQVTPHKAADYEQLSLQKVYGKLRSADLSLGEDVGEYRQTIEMLRNPLKQLRTFLVADRSRNLKLLKALAKRNTLEVNRLLGRTGHASAEALASTWLELRYGLRPLIMLVQDAIEKIENNRKRILDPDKIRSRRSELKFGPIKTWVEPSITYGGMVYVRSRCLVEDTYYSTASVQYQQSVEDSLLDQLGLTPRFLPETAWQLTKLSFVVDWIFTIGPWLATLRINPGINVLGNTSGFKHERRVTVFSTQLRTGNRSWAIPWTELPKVHLVEGDLAFVTDMYERKINLNLSYLPHFTWGRTLDLFKAIDSISLIWQFAKKVKR